MTNDAEYIASDAPHVSVLLAEALDGLKVAAGGRYVDATLGAGGHSRAILERAAPDGTLLALDADPTAITLARTTLADVGLAERATLVETNFRHIARVAREHGFDPADGALFDLGVSSMQIDTPARGFSFAHDGPLDMRMGPSAPRSAADIINHETETELARIFFEYGEETQSRRFARAIVQDRQITPFTTTKQLADLIARLSRGGASGRERRPIHPATRVFQALRIAANDELDALEAALAGAVDILKPGGRLAVISFHSLEDRIVKHFIQQEIKGCICPPEILICQCGRVPRLVGITKKPQTAGETEIARNRRSRSAKLRVAEKM